jgi:hypothetical protein
VYGQANPPLTASYFGFVNGDNSSVVSGAASLNTTATAASGAGDYTITAAQGTLRSPRLRSRSRRTTRARSTARRCRR